MPDRNGAEMIQLEARENPIFSRWLWATLLGLSVFLYELMQPAGSPAVRISWYSILIIVVAAGVTRACRAQRQFDLFEPPYMVLALFLIFYPVRALFAVWLDDSWF